MDKLPNLWTRFTLSSKYAHACGGYNFKTNCCVGRYIIRVDIVIQTYNSCTNVARAHRNVVIIIITQTAAIALEPLTTHPDVWAEPSHK